MNWRPLMTLVCAGGFGCLVARAIEAPPVITGLTATNGQPSLTFSPYPAAEAYKVLKTPDLKVRFIEDKSGGITNFQWSSPLASPQGFFRLQVQPMNTNKLAATTLLNRIAYGPTPDELDRVLALGPDAYIAEQLAPEAITESVELTAGTQTDNGWVRVVATGTASSSKLVINMTAPGIAYLDDVKLVAGTNPDAGVNLVANGNFESALNSSPWVVARNLTASAVTVAEQHAGASSLKLVANFGTGGDELGITQSITPALAANATYTLSFYCKPPTNGGSLTVHLAGGGLDASTEAGLPGIERRLAGRRAALDDLRGWHLQRAIKSKRQLLNTLLQFTDNHFVTQYLKSFDYINLFYDDFAIIDRIATDFEYREMMKWEQALLNPQCTFYDLLKVSAESPAMIIYLDTVSSKGNGGNIANENYARELLELFTFGVDNGYDQNDIVVLSRVWTGWSVDYLPIGQVDNPFAARTTNRISGVTSNFTDVTNLVGVWGFKYNPVDHNTGGKIIFPGKTVPARFGQPWAGRPYEWVRVGRGGTNGILDGYDIIQHLANQPFTEEFISVKLCRLLVHEDFVHGVYDYTDPNLSPEGRLVHQCMLAWENSSPKGQLREVLKVILNSELFRSHDASRQKVKTPLEFVAGSVRALRAGEGLTATAEADNGDMITALDRMGAMQLFNRAEPDGYPESGSGWISAGTLAERLRWVEALLLPAGQSGKADAAGSVCNPVEVIRRKVAPADWQNAAAVAAYFCNLLFPGEGQGNLNDYEQLAVKFLNTSDNGFTASPFNLLSMSGSPSPYELRVRGMVAFLMTLPRFQEQ